MSELERLRTQLRRLALPAMAQIFEEEATNAAKGQLSVTAFLTRLADAEMTAKGDDAREAWWVGHPSRAGLGQVSRAIYRMRDFWRTPAS